MRHTRFEPHLLLAIANKPGVAALLPSEVGECVKAVPDSVYQGYATEKVSNRGAQCSRREPNIMLICQPADELEFWTPTTPEIALGLSITC
jgi:hypothetical protein